MESVGTDGESRPFKHPILQVWGLNIGEFCCIIFFYFLKGIKTCKNGSDTTPKQTNASPTDEKEKKSFNSFLFLPASVMHVISRMLIFIALTFTSASSYQMLSGSNLIFTCILSRIFLHKKLKLVKWIGVLVILGEIMYKNKFSTTSA